MGRRDVSLVWILPPPSLAAVGWVVGGIAWSWTGWVLMLMQCCLCFFKPRLSRVQAQLAA